VLGTPDADQYFTGRKFSARFLASGALPGPLGTAVRATAPSDSLAINPAIPKNPVVSGPAGMGVGGLIGFGAAKRFGFGAGKSIALGAAIGGTMGAAAPLTGALSYTRRNKDFFTESPYGRSSSANAELSAVGDIVLGMHNSRRGY
jgi:membrane associated rhomboid family serine protease